MNDPYKNLPPHVQALVDAHLKNVEPPPRRDRDREWAAKLDRCREVTKAKCRPGATRALDDELQSCRAAAARRGR